ncbi:MAG: glutamate synthase subunit beta [Nocardia sp.]|nr:glutamate synthase subunit beta [Nocardia sp.]
MTVFERDDRIGGLLRYGIPEFKMEKRFIDRRLAQMEAEGTIFKAGVNVGVDITAEQLRERFDAVVLAGGSTIARDLPIPGRDLDGIHQAMEFLPLSNRVQLGDGFDENGRPVLNGGSAHTTVSGNGHSASSVPGNGHSASSVPGNGHSASSVPPITAKGKKVVIIGGGDTGADCLGTSHRQGAVSVHQFEIMPKPPAERADSTPWPTYPLMYRVSSAHEEGGERVYSVNTERFVGREDEHGRQVVTGLQAHEVTNVNGRFEKVEGTEFTLDADLVLLAMGFVGPQKPGLLEDLGVGYDQRGNVKRGKDWQTTVPGVFVAGDMGRGQSLIVWAIAEGRSAASAVDNYLEGETALPAPIEPTSAPQR